MSCSKAFSRFVMCGLLLMLSAGAFGAGYSIEITVLDNANTAVTGVAFTIDGSAVTAAVNAAKHYVIQGIASGSHTIKAFKPGMNFAAEEQWISLPTSGQSYSPNGRLDFSGMGVYSIGGQVYRMLADGKKQGIRNFYVTLNSSSPTSASTDLDGRYSFAGLTPGTYTLRAVRPGFTVTTPTLTINLAAKSGDANDDGVVDSIDRAPMTGQLLGVRPAPGNMDGNKDGKNNIADVVWLNTHSASAVVADFKVTGSCKITGTVKTSTGAAIAGATVTCVGTDSGGGNDIPVGSATTNSSGSYTISGLPPGLYTVIPIANQKALSPATASADLIAASSRTMNFVAAAANDPSAVLPLALQFVKDSDGTTVINNGMAVLLFEPNGVVDLYVSAVTDAIAYQGTYVYNAGKLTIKFADPDFTRSATITLGTASTLTLPFKVFSEGSGSSTWTKKTPSVLDQLCMIFNAASFGWPAAYYDEAMARVLAYGQAMISAGATVANAGPQPAATPAPRKIKVVGPLKNGVKVKFDSGPTVNLLFFTWSNNDGTPISAHALFNDPRLNIDPTPGEQDSDPTNRTALLITPFFSNHNLAWYDATFLGRAANYETTRKFHYSMESDDNVVGMTDLLEHHVKHPYRVIQIRDNQVTVPRLIDELTKSPGFVYFSSHGGSDGSVVTGTYIGPSSDSVTSLTTQFQRLINQWSANATYRSILNYKSESDGNLTTIQVVKVPHDLGSKVEMVSGSFFVAIMPNFWEALRVRGGASLSDSLVYISACDTDATPDLRQAIRSRAYFGYSVAVPSEFAGMVFQYLVKHLKRRTHSAEEAYYNIIRIAQTRQMIYVEDTGFQNMIPRVEAKINENTRTIVHIKDMFRGYGCGVTTNEVMPYRDNGWLTTNLNHTGQRPDFDPGAVWWMLFAARWGSDAQASADNIINNYWKNYWGRGRNGGLADQGCQNTSPGRIPHTPELSYMAYLLIGQPYRFKSPPLVPRWTMSDAK